MSSESPALDVQVEDAGPCSKVLKIKIPASRVDREIEETYKNVQKSVQFPGFRPGKAPRKLVEAKLGERVMQEVLERLVQTVYDEAVDSTKLKTVGTPRPRRRRSSHGAPTSPLRSTWTCDPNSSFRSSRNSSRGVP